MGKPPIKKLPEISCFDVQRIQRQKSEPGLYSAWSSTIVRSGKKDACSVPSAVWLGEDNQHKNYSLIGFWQNR